MSNDNQPDLRRFIQQTERAVTSVAEVLNRQNRNFPPTNSPTPPLIEQSDREPATPESDTDEIQDAWLATLDLKINDFRKCLDEFSDGLSSISQNVENLEADARIKHAEADGKITDNGLRKEMADKTFGFMERWCIFVALLIFIYFAKNEGNPPTEVMLALLGTCTVSIIGLVGFVVSGLFKSSTKNGGDK